MEALVKLLTLPLTKKQVESSMAVQSLKPRIDMMKARYGDDQAKIKRETNFLYEQAGVNPLAGCLPSIVTIPIFIGLYRSLTNVATEGLLDTQGFYWIPSLAGPTSINTRGTEWLFPFVDGAPASGWDNALPYLVLPVLLVACQYVSSSIISPPIDPNAENANTQRALYTFLPMMIGWFALNVPSGLGLYYLANTVMTTLIQVWLRKLGGADVQINELGPITKVGTGRRMGQAVSDDDVWKPSAAYQASIEADAAAAAAAAEAGAANAAAEIVRINPQLLGAGGLDPSKEAPQNIASFSEMLAKGFLPVNLSLPGLRVQNIDPPVLTVEQFLPGEVCDALRQAAQASGKMKVSGVGGTGDLKEDIRTSSTLAITKEVLADCPEIKPLLQQLLDRAVQLLGDELDTAALSGMQFVRPTAPTQLAPELPQIAHYLPGQHFLSHEDGFPSAIALDKGYQRRATLLIYLNDVLQGGQTQFDHLGFGVQPQRGKALLFFPSFSGGKSDARTLHTAEDAAEGAEKWVFQLWLCAGLPIRPKVDAAAMAAQQLAAQRKGGVSPQKPKRANKKKQR
ncbi:hypothetical protein OEZ85_011533 [Tetradesmus obliquus]|uniref:Fe2OG dioxygenase domain-containing protein n=1 Tax=Tetradesmus obliquus TaxID=3088 RepID=A0ABY8TUJ1_TETOB|nr:hypothetical protein OEZ85_011533 [Tetradesmus obliquus]